MSDLAQPTSQFVSVAGVRLHYQSLGGSTDKLPIIFTHGGGLGCTAWSNFRRSAPVFADQYQCYFLDFAQFGQSAMVPVQGSVLTWHAQKLRAFIDALGLKKCI